MSDAFNTLVNTMTPNPEDIERQLLETQAKLEGAYLAMGRIKANPHMPESRKTGIGIARKNLRKVMTEVNLLILEKPAILSAKAAMVICETQDLCDSLAFIESNL